MEKSKFQPAKLGQSTVGAGREAFFTTSFPQQISSNSPDLEARRWGRVERILSFALYLSVVWDRTRATHSLTHSPTHGCSCYFCYCCCCSLTHAHKCGNGMFVFLFELFLKYIYTWNVDIWLVKIYLLLIWCFLSVSLNNQHTGKILLITITLLVFYVVIQTSSI